MPVYPAFGIRRYVTALTLGVSIVLPLPAWPCSWSWTYSAPGIAASGTLTTADTRDAGGFYLITGIAGARNGAQIIGLQPTATSIPGNEPYAGDNLIRSASPQLTKHGFGFATAKGDYANPFYTDFLAKPGYLEFFSKPPFAAPDTSEVPVSFSASIIAAPGSASSSHISCGGA